MKHNKVYAMILAAGLGTRLGTVTQNKPKALVELNGKSLLLLVIEKLVNSGFTNIIINVHHYAEQVVAALSDLHFPGVSIQFSNEQDELLDTGGGILKARPLFGDAEAVLVHNVDIVSDMDLRLFAEGFLSSDDDAWLATQMRKSSRKLLFNEQELLVGWSNIQSHEYKWVLSECQRYNALSFSGIHCFRTNLFSDYRTKKCSIIDLYLDAAKNHRIKAQSWPYNYWFDLGKTEQLSIAADFLKAKNKP